MKRHLLFISLLFSISVLCSQNLRRQVDFGAQVSSVTKAMATELGLENPTGVYISTIIPDGSAEVLEIREKDVLLSIGDSTIKNPYDYEMILSSYRGGDPVSIKLWRGGQTIEVTGILLAKTKEDPGLGQVIYDEVPFEGGFLRTITLTPSEQLEKMPAVLFIPSASCSSIDNLSSWHPYKKLLGTLTEKGMAVMRVEKSGLGDNFNTPSCDEISFEQEKAMYLAGLNQLKGYEFVDTNNIFILGHDLGGLMAPVIANHPETDIKGVMVYGTFLESWVEYLLQLARFQTPKLGRDYVKSSAEYKELFKISFELFENGKSPAVLANENESYKATLQSTFGWDGADGILGRNFKFWYDIQALNMVSEWAKCESYVQVLAGNVDLKTPDLNQQKEIVKIVNTYHPDKAKFMLAENTNHIFLKLESEKEGIEAMKDPEKMFGLYQSNFNFTLVEKMGDWILETAEK